MADTLVQALTELLEPVVASTGLFLEGVETTRAGRYSTVRVLVDLADGPGDLDLDSLTEVSQAVSQALDEADPVKGQYTLEVSTPGAERELVTARHRRRAVGHTVHVTTTAGEELTGVLTQAGEEALVVQAEDGERTVTLDELGSARVVVTA